MRLKMLTETRPTRKAKLMAKPVQQVDLPKRKIKTETGDFFQDAISDDSDFSQSSDSSDCSSYSRGSKKRKRTACKTKARIQPAKKQKVVRQASPEAPEMSEMDSEEEHEEDLRLFEKKSQPLTSTVKATVTSNVLRLEVRSAPTTIVINLKDLLPKQPGAGSRTPSTDLDGSTIFDNESGESSIGAAMTDPNDFTNMRLNQDYASFLELEPELRNRIYREMLVDEKVVKFSPAPRSTRQTAILRTCRQVHEEGRGILYGENAFHFNRVLKERGRYYDHEYKEIGYKDTRRFLETIGSENIAKLRFVSLHLSDAYPSFTPNLETSERRYVNDPVLHHVLRLLGKSGCILEKFVVGFVGRSELDLGDVLFIRAFTSISCRKLSYTCGFGHCKFSPQLFDKMQKFMEIPKLVDIDEMRRKIPTMQHEESRRDYQCPYSHYRLGRRW